MALVTGPLLSLDARGKMGGALVFSNWKGRPTVRKLVTPSNPKSGAQTGQRAMMGFLSRIWSSIAIGYGNTWEALAEEGKFSPFNAFTKYNLQRWTQFEPPVRYIDDLDNEVPVMGALTVTGGVRQIEVSQVITTANDMWGMLIALSTQNAFDPAKSDVVAGVALNGSPVTYTISGLAAGTYYVRTSGFTYGGTQSAWVSQGTASVT